MLFAEANVWIASATWSASSRVGTRRSEEHTSELQSQSNLGCRLLLDNKIGIRSYRATTRACSLESAQDLSVAIPCYTMAILSPPFNRGRAAKSRAYRLLRRPHDRQLT